MADKVVIVKVGVEDKEVAQANRRVEELSNSIQLLTNNIKKSRNENGAFEAQLQELDKTLKTNGKLTAAEALEVQRLSSKIAENNKEIAKNTIERSKQKSELNANIKLLNAEANSRELLRQKIAVLNKEYLNLNQGTKAGKKRSEELQKELKTLNDTMNESTLASGKFHDNIGNYPEGMGNAEKATDKLGDSFKELLANPIVAVLALIAIALKTLFSAFQRSANGAKLMTKATARLEGVFLVLVKAMDVLAIAMTKAFEDPKQAVDDLWVTIKQNLLNRVLAIPAIFKSLFTTVVAEFKILGASITVALSKVPIIGEAIDGEKATANLKKALGELADSALDLGQALIQSQTGIDVEQQKKLAKEFENAAKQAQIYAEKMAILTESQLVMRGESRGLEKDIATLTAELEVLSEQLGDDTQNMDDMRKSSQLALEKSVELAKKQEELAQIRFNSISEEVIVRKKAGEQIEDLLDQQVQAEIDLINAKSRSAIEQQKIVIGQRKIERDIFEQNLDILLDVGDKIKTEQERQITNESLSLDKRKQLLEDSKTLLSANFESIKKEYELYGVTAEQINDVINASDANQANEKLKALGINEIAVNRLREIILERKQAELDFNDLSKSLSEEEIERKQTANDTIKEINDERTLSELTNAKDISDKLIEIEKEKLNKKLENEALTFEERLALQAKFDQTVKALEIEAEELEAEKLEKKKESDGERRERELGAIRDQLDAISDITAQFGASEAAIFGKMGADLAQAYIDGGISAESAIQGVSTVANAVFDVMSDRKEKALEESEASRQAELAGAEGNAEAQKAINEKYDKEQAKLKLKQFRADKAAAVVNIAIQTSLAVMKALGQLGPIAGAIASGLIIATGAVQAGIVIAKKPPKFGQGTSDIVNIGDSHASGNDVDMWAFAGNQRQFMGKVERGEAMPVIKKTAVNNYQIAKLNGAFNPHNYRKFADGTPDITEQLTPQATQIINQPVETVDVAVNKELLKYTIVARIEDIATQLDKKIEIQSNGEV